MTWNGSMAGHLNGFLAWGGGEFEHTFFKNSNARGFARGDVEASIWLVHKRHHKNKHVFLPNPEMLFISKIKGRM